MNRPSFGPLLVIAILVTNLESAAVDVIPNDRTVAERIRNVDAVLLVRATGAAVVRGEDLAPAVRAESPELTIGPLLFAIIEQDLEIIEVMKGGAIAAGTAFRAGTSGGHTGMDLASNWRSRTLDERGTYVLFLSYVSRAKQWRYHYCDLFRVDTPEVLPACPITPYAKTLLGLSSSAAIAFIRDAAKSGQR